MDLGTCPTCATPYTTPDVVGLGILRPRPALEGGPLLEYRCAGCGKVLTLIPHGEGRYAPPGQPPPPPVPPEARRPRWVRQGAPEEPPRRAPSAAQKAPAPEAPAAERPAASSSSSPSATATTSPEPTQSVGPLEALQLLGVGLTAGREEIERAFRARSLACHPDKVAHLDAEFQALAERKFKRLVEAFRLLVDAQPP